MARISNGSFSNERTLFSVGIFPQNIAEISRDDLT
jgi:hypothetical protein